MDFWTIASAFSCLITSAALLVMVFDLGKETPAFYRYLTYAAAVAFLLAFASLAFARHPLHNTAGYLLTSLAVMAVSTIAYLIRKGQVNRSVLRFALLGIGIVTLLWLLDSCRHRNAEPVTKPQKPEAVTRPSEEEEDLQNRYMPLGGPTQ